MIELMVVIMIILIVSAIAITALTPNLQQARVDAQMKTVIATLRQAREFAIAHRRYVQISFPANNQIQVTQFNAPPLGPGGVNTVLTTVTLAPPLVFNLDGMPDTPDGYGNSELSEALFRIVGTGQRKLAVTARNWSTSTKLLSLCEEK